MPGGALDYEDPIDGIKREIQEETMLEVDKVYLIHAVSFLEGEDHVVVYGYKTFSENTDVDLSWEHDKYVWVDPKDIEEYNLPEMHRSFVEKSLEQK